MTHSWILASTALLATVGIAAVAYWWRRRRKPDTAPSPSHAAAPPPDIPSLRVRDIDEALRITGGSVEVADMLIADMAGSLPDQLAQARQALEPADWERLRALIHRIKGATAVCAVPALHHAVCELQRAAREADGAAVRVWLDRVETERQRLVAELDVGPAG